MNMTPKQYLFFDNCGDCEEVWASSLAAATCDLPEDFIHEWHEVRPLWHIAKLTEDGTWEILSSYLEEEDADAMLDEFCDQYPNSYVEILYGDKVAND